MRDQRIDQWANVLVNYSLEAKPEEHVVVYGEIEALPLIEACYEKLLQAGALVEVFLTSKGLTEMQFTYANDKQLQTPPPVGVYAAETCDCYLIIGAEMNSKLLSQFDPQRQTLASKSREPIIKALLDRSSKSNMRWTYTHFPTPSAAQDAEMGTKEYEEFILSLGFLNHENPIQAWKDFSKAQQNLIEVLKDKKELHFKTDSGTDLRVNISGMNWINCAGKINFPDGEVFTGPNLKAEDGGVNGVARFALPTLYHNIEVHDIELTFEKGVVVDAKASKGEAFLKEMIQIDDGAKRVGEIAIGTNFLVNRITKNILFDEKFGGTFHLALGRGYPETGNHNESALHWDMIFDLRSGGAITADSETILKNGTFTHSDWPQR